MREDNDIPEEELENDGNDESWQETNDDDGEGAVTQAHSTYVPKDNRMQLSGMFRNWYLDYASYVILERAVPHIEDGLKPVQRRILHTMKELDDGRYNKVANIVGFTMQYHPHGDASIKDALVQLGQKNLLIDTQGNWGNIFTGDDAAAGRYIEARLSEFALDVAFSPKITDWGRSYDGRKPEPITLPVKFPLVLFHGAEGIAVGLSTKILPHNFNEIIDAAVAYLRGEPFQLYPDFPTGGYVDVRRYNDGERGGQIRARAKIEKRDSKTLVINDLPYGYTTPKLIESILLAQRKGKIKIKKIDDNTSSTAEIIVTLQPGTSSDKTIDALYAFTNCEASISPNCCVIEDKKPKFLSVSDILRNNVDHTKDMLRRELEIQRGETLESIHFASLEKIFIEERMYKDKEFEDSRDLDEAIAHIDRRLEPWKPSFYREVTRDDILKLLEIKTRRFTKFDSDKADEYIAMLRDRITKIDYELEHIVDYTIEWFEGLKAKYGAMYPRRTIIRNFDTIEATKVAEANEKLYINREEGFIGTSLKKDEFVCNCSDIDDVIIFYKDGKYKVIKVAEKIYVGKNILYLNVFKRNDSRTIYNVVYQDGKGGVVYMKRFAVTGITRDKEYDLTQGKPGSKVLWFTANPNGEAEVLRITLKPKFRLKVLQFDVDLADLAIKGKQSRGNVVTKNEVHRISLKERGTSTLGGREVWFDPDVLRLNYDGRGRSLGEFAGTDQVLVVCTNGEYYTTSFDSGNHYSDDILRIEKFRPHAVWTAVLFDADQGYVYVKRFEFEPSVRRQNFIGGNADSRLMLLTDKRYPRFDVKFGGGDSFRENIVIDAEEFIGVKSFKAKGKRISNYMVEAVTEIEPREVPEDEEVETADAEIDDGGDAPDEKPICQQDVLDELTGQKKLFDIEPDDGSSVE